MFDELITSGAEAVPFLRRQILERNEMRPFSHEADHKNGLFFEADIPQTKTQPSGKFYVNVDTSICTGRFTVSFLTVGGRLKKKGMGLVAAKGLLGSAHERGLPALYVNRANSEGPPFWLWLGATTVSEPPGLADEFRESANTASLRRAEDRDVILRMADTAEENTRLALRQAMRSDIYLNDGTPWKIPFLTEALQNENMVFVLDEYSTRETLQRRLGRLPDGKPIPPGDAMLERIVEQLRGAPVLN